MASLKKLQKLVLDHLDAGEEVIYSVYGAYETKIMGTNTVRNGAFFATSMRLVFYPKELFGFDLEVFPYENISSIEMGKGLIGHHKSFFASGNKVKVKTVDGTLGSETTYLHLKAWRCVTLQSCGLKVL